MNTLRTVALSTVLLGGMTVGATAQLADAITPDPGFEPDWVTLGVATFENTEEQRVNVGTGEGRDLDMIALQPLTAGIACVEMNIGLEGSADAYEFPIERATELDEDSIYKVPLQGENNMVTSVELACRSTTGAPAIVQLYGIPSGLTGLDARTPY